MILASRLSWLRIVIMAGVLLGEILGSRGKSDLIEGLVSSYLSDEGTLEIEGRTIIYKASMRGFAFPVVYDAVARDTETGITATAEKFDHSEDAYMKAVANLFAILRQRGLMKDPSAPDATAPESETSPGQEPEAKPTDLPESEQPSDSNQPTGDVDPEDGEPIPEEPAQKFPEPEPDFPEPEPDQNRDPVPGADEKLLPEPELPPEDRSTSGGVSDQNEDKEDANGDQHGHKPRSLIEWSLRVVGAIATTVALQRCFQFLPMGIISGAAIIGVLYVGWNIFTTVITTNMSFVVMIIALPVAAALINIQMIVAFVLKLVKSLPKLQTFVQPAGMLLEVTPDYQGSYAAHRMKPAEPTPDMLAPRYTYKLWSPCKGVAFILNNATFESGQREGSDIDLENVVHLFQELGYMVMSYTDKKGQEIKDSMRTFAAMFNQEGTPYDSAVVVLMSHGEKGVILGTDGVRVYLRDLQRELEGDRCPGLKGKPKMFFVQACRGNSMTPTLPVVSDGPSSQLTGGESSPTPPEWILPVEPDDEFASSLQDKADVHFAYASIDGHLSLRSEAIGSFFVQALCEVFFANAHRDNLDTLMNKVTGRVIRMRGKLYDHESGQWILINQTPEVIKSMRKALYFLPKYSKTK